MMGRCVEKALWRARFAVTWRVVYWKWRLTGVRIRIDAPRLPDEGGDER